MKRNTMLLVLFATLQAGAARADVILQYETAPSTTSPTLAPSVAHAAIAAASMAAGGGLTANAGATWNWAQWNTASTSFAAAVAAGDFWTWGFDVVAPGATISLATLDIRLDRSGTGPDDFAIQASVNGGPAIGLLTFDFADTDIGVNFLGVSLGAIPALKTGDSIVFTLAAFNSEGTSGTFDLETIEFGGADPRALRVEGSVAVLAAVPEPSMLALTGTMLAAAALSRVRRSRTGGRM